MKNDSVKIAYIITQCVVFLFLMTMSIIIPIYLDTGNYWWTAGLIVLAMASSVGYTERLNSWDKDEPAE